MIKIEEGMETEIKEIMCGKFRNIKAFQFKGFENGSPFIQTIVADTLEEALNIKRNQ